MNKILCISVLISTAVIVVNCYNFDDSDYNQLLAEDLIDLYNSYDQPLSNVRNRRDEEAVAPEKCKSKRKKPCCAEESIEKIHDSELKRSCFKEVHSRDKEPKTDTRQFDPFSCDRVDRHRREMTCVHQCIGQKKNVLDDEGNPKEAEFREFIKESFAKESWFGSFQDKIISTCLAEAKNATANADKEKDACNPAGVKLGHCLFRETQLNCPADQIKDEKSCARLQERLKQKGDFLPPPPPHEPFLHDE